MGDPPVLDPGDEGPESLIDKGQQLISYGEEFAAQIKTLIDEIHQRVAGQDLPAEFKKKYLHASEQYEKSLREMGPAASNLGSRLIDSGAAYSATDDDGAAAFSALSPGGQAGTGSAGATQSA